MKATVSKAMIRRKIREVINMRPGFGKTEPMLLDGVNELTGGGVSLQELRDGIEWNHSERLIRSEENTDSDETEWFITPEGIAKQKI